MIERHNLQKTYAYIDNITVTGADQNEHDKNLKALIDAAKTEEFTFNQTNLCSRFVNRTFWAIAF